MAQPSLNAEQRSLVQEIGTTIEVNPGSYRFLYTEPKSLDSQYLFVGLNPGGVETDPPILFMEAGNAVLDENWAGATKNSLQYQIMYFFEDLAKELGRSDWIPYMTEWMISNYVFYRSLGWKEMAAKKAHVQTCKDIWRRIFTKKVPKIIVANGYETQIQMVKLLEEFGWKNVVERRAGGPWEGPHLVIMELGDEKCLTIGFAHLSRFPIIRRGKNQEYLKTIYAEIKAFH